MTINLFLDIYVTSTFVRMACDTFVYCESGDKKDETNSKSIVAYIFFFIAKLFIMHQLWIRQVGILLARVFYFILTA